MTSTKLLITGGTGYIGSHIISLALEAGYTVNATARPNKADRLKRLFGETIRVFEIEDIATGDHEEALDGVDAIIHVAAPLPWAININPADVINGSINGTLSILRQGLAKGIRKAIVTSSAITLVNMETEEITGEGLLDEHSWSDVTHDEALQEGKSQEFYYGAAKTISEREVWKFAEEHPEMDITTIVPPYVFGPLLPGAQVKKNDVTSMSTLGTIFKPNVFPKNPSSVVYTKSKQNISPTMVDVRDVARAHILAVAAPPLEVGHKRLLFDGPSFLWYDAVKYLRETRPELRDRLPQISEEGERFKNKKMDNTKANEILGMEERIEWRQTVDDSVDELLRVENIWAKE